MDPRYFRPIFESVIQYFGSALILQQWALDLLALGPHAQWVEPQEIEVAFKNEFFDPRQTWTDAGDALRYIANGAPFSEVILKNAAFLYGRDDVPAMLEVLFARSQGDMHDLIRGDIVFGLLWHMSKIDREATVRSVVQAFRAARLPEDEVRDMTYALASNATLSEEELSALLTNVTRLGQRSLLQKQLVGALDVVFSDKA